MRINFFTLVIISICVLHNASMAQTGPAGTGVVKGVVWDSAQATAMAAATVAVYQQTDTALITYTLCGKNGAFTLRQLPIGRPLKIIASFVGYKPVTRHLQLSSADTTDLGRVYMSIAAGALEEVVVVGVQPPVRMKGDTLEFNADAFKLDANAQTEDLLRALPGVTVWNDGSITVNGREVSSVLVNGKPFFGGDARVATQNIPKNIVDKIQVYQKDIDNRKKDSLTEMNIKLKKGKDAGYFGKISAGYGNRKYYEMDGSLNFFNRRTQLSIGGIRNNVNKMADGMSFLLANHTFKGPGANVGYQSNFSIPGLTIYSAGGVFLQHDFLPDPTYQNTDRLIAEYFVSENKQYLLKDLQTITTLNDSTYFLQHDRSENNSSRLNHEATIHYEKKTKTDRLTIKAILASQTLDGDRNDSSIVRNETGELLSTNSVSSRENSTNTNVSLIGNFSHNAGKNRSLSRYDIGYNVNLNDYATDLQYRSVYLTLINPIFKRDLSRIYNNQYTQHNHKLKWALPCFISGIFPSGFFSRLNMGIKTDVEVGWGKQQSLVMDSNNPLDHYQINSYLTNERKETTTNIKPAITFDKIVQLQATKATSKMLSFDFSYGPQFFSLHSTSQKAFQQFSRSYQKGIGQAALRFENVRTAIAMNTLSLQATASSQYPGVEKLAPLVDSANLNYIQTGNPFLKEQDTKEISVNFSHTSLRPQNTFNYSFDVRGGRVDNFFANYSHIDTLGRMLNTYVNANGYRYASFNAQLRKSYKIKSSQFQLSVSPTVSLNRMPAYINDVFSYFYNTSVSCNPAIGYSFKDRVELNFANKYTHNWYKQSGEHTIDIANKINQMELSVYLRCTKKLSLGSNVLYTTNTFEKLTRTTFTIWNASVAQRIFSGNNAEIKFVALDLLRQNTGIINYGANNSVTNGKANSLQQYFMVTLSWYPRKFGNNKSN